MTAALILATLAFYTGGIVAMLAVLTEARNESDEAFPLVIQLKFAALWPLALWRAGV